ncbi:MAG: tetratricopeptide repeat protein [Oligoflexia bacterium]|nr:tetratricopeptide repeat protein [Oligoflexia bacterium]
MVQSIILLLLNITFCSANSQLTSALNAYENAQYDAARSEFLKLADETQFRFTAFYNLGNVAIKQGRVGEALAYYRKAQKYKPRDSALNFNILFVTQQNKILPPAGAITFFDILKQEVLSKFTFFEVSILNFIILLLFFYGCIRFLVKRSAKDQESYLPTQLIIFSVLLGLCSFMTGFKLFDSYIDRATIITKAELKSGPNETNAALTEIQEGSEVYVVAASGPWNQVTIPGSLTGWVKQEQLIQTSGEGPW